MTRTLIALFALLMAAPALAQSVAPPQVALETSMGTITLELDPAHAPKTVANFLRYVQEGHYDGTAIYRVVPGFVIQAGSYLPSGSYRPVHDPIALESDNGLKNIRGALAMARTGEPDSATAEFFIDLGDHPSLDPTPGAPPNTTGYAVFGHVVGGQDVLDAIAGVPLGDHGPMPGAAPVTPIPILKASIMTPATQ